MRGVVLFLLVFFISVVMFLLFPAILPLDRDLASLSQGKHATEIPPPPPPPPPPFLFKAILYRIKYITPTLTTLS